MKTRLGLAFLLAATLAQSQESLEPLMLALSSDDAAIRAEAACRIGRLGFRAERAAAPLIELLSDASMVEDIDCDHRGWHKGPGPLQLRLQVRIHEFTTALRCVQIAEFRDRWQD